ncbi:uncharacterized protein LOC126615417 isoform X7 [Malus sylvestris]|uniref:uncharacterized protein LOC126615417 isoform X7 n=1 Tax=Malus sylvestris TaxID=3752 RepID=UPI0021ABB003|nr:uncharacterized protein LOC126615417 isoform X7 [Malus sylvestris]
MKFGLREGENPAFPNLACLLGCGVSTGIEPWSFEQHLGKVVFIPAGCPFQAREKELIKQKALEKARKLQVKKNRMFQRKKYTRAHLEIAGGYRHMVYMK